MHTYKSTAIMDIEQKPHDLSDIHKDVLQTILAKVTIGSLYSLKQTCRRLHDAAENERMNRVHDLAKSFGRHWLSRTRFSMHIRCCIRRSFPPDIIVKYAVDHWNRPGDVEEFSMSSQMSVVTPDLRVLLYTLLFLLRNGFNDTHTSLWHQVCQLCDDNLDVFTASLDWLEINLRGDDLSFIVFTAKKDFAIHLKRISIVIFQLLVFFHKIVPMGTLYTLV